MKLWRRLSFSRQIGLALSGVSLLTLLLACAGFVTVEILLDRWRSADQIGSSARIVASNASAALAFFNRQDAREVLEALAADRRIVYARICDAGGAVFAEYSPGRVFRTDGLAPCRTGGNAQPGTIVVTAPVSSENRSLGAVEIHARVDPVAVVASRYLGALGIVGLLSLVLAGWCGLFLRRVIAAPLLSLAATAGRITSVRDYSLRALPVAGAELSRLVASFNAMLDQIEARDRELRMHQERLERTVEERTRELVLARNRAEESARLKSEFLANMSHEIRTPLNGVMGMLQLVLETPLTLEQRDCLETAGESARTLMALLNDILDLSKIEAGRLSLERVSFSVAEVLDEAVRPLAMATRQKGLDLRWTVARDIPALVTGDPLRLRQVLTNLIGNAVKFTERGSIQVSAALVEARDAGWLIEVAVADTGIGIEAHKLESIFDAFTQADGSITRRYGGSGLGLSICARLVALMGGRISVESTPHAGSIFRFTAQFGRSEEATATEPHPPATVSAARQTSCRLRVLLAEDNPVNQKVESKALSYLGHRVTLVANGLEALDALNRTRFDVVLMDVQMPEMDGLEATRVLRQREAERRLDPVPVIALTANALAGDRERCMKAGMNGYLPKPFDLVALSEALARCCPAQAAHAGSAPNSA